MYLDVGPQRKEYTTRALFEIFNYIQQAVNYMDPNNFPNGISGGIINAGTMLSSAYSDHAIPMVKMAWKEHPIPLVLPASAFTTTSTTAVNIGGYFAWDSANFPGGDWYLEATIASSDATATVTCGLQGGAEYGTVTTNATSLTRVRSATKITMPTVIENLWITLRISDSTKTASLYSARLIFVPY